MAATARDLGDPGKDYQFGYGLLDAARSVGVSAQSEPKPPVFTSTPVTAAKEGSPYNYTALATDPDADNVTYKLEAAPSGMSIEAVTGVISWTPTYMQAGSYTVTIRATDSGGLSVDQTYTLTVADAKKKFRLVRTSGKSNSDALVVPLEQGTYSIEITNLGLRSVGLRTSDAPYERELTDVLQFRRRSTQMIEFDYNAGTPTSLIFIPHGIPEKIADIIVSRTN